MKFTFIASEQFYFFGAYYSTKGFLCHDSGISLPAYGYNNHYTFFLDENFCKKYEIKLWNKALKDYSFLNKIKEKITFLEKGFIKRVQKINLEQLTSRQLFDLYKLVYNFFIYYEAEANPIARLLDHYGLTVIRKQLSNVKIPDVDYAVTVLVTSSKPSYLGKEQQIFWQGMLKYKNQSVRNKFIQRHLKNFAYVTRSFYDEPVLTEQELNNRIKKTPSVLWEEKAEEIEKSIKKSLIEKKKLIKTLKLSKNILKSAEVLQKSTELKDYIRGSLSKIWYHSEVVFEEIAKRMETSVLVVKTLLVEELKQSLINHVPLNKKIIQARLNGPILFLPTKKRTMIYYGDKAEKLISRHFKNSQKIPTIEFRGRPVSRGIAMGKVRVINNLTEAKKILRGEILVVSNTYPAFVPYLKRVKGIIAEVGGATVHVAIIARELSLPCIIGITNAREIFKNGEIVKIDANHGIVRRLNRR